MAGVRDRMAADHGRVFEVAGRQLAAFPEPAALLAVQSVPGLPAVKVERLHAVARAAEEGLLDTERLRALGPEEGHQQLQTLPGIGPFYASLIVLRAIGFTDVPVTEEPMALQLMGALYGLGRAATAADVERLTDSWRPWRTWATVLLRAAGPVLISESAGAVS
jgi:DNA-3-methyladenine glycosylase II